MAKLRSQVVSRASCAVVAAELGLGERLLEQPSGPGERRAGPARRQPERPRGAARGGARRALPRARLRGGRGPIVDAFEPRIEYALTHKVDHKTELQEELARRGRSVSYALLASEGPAHERHVHRGRADRRRAGRGRARAARRRTPSRRPPARRSTGSAPLPAAAEPSSGVRRRPADFPRVHLKTIKLRGFKSFVDPVEVRLEPGVAVVVGPNGSGQVEHLRRDPLGDRLAEPARAARREARRRPLRRLGRPQAVGLLRGRARLRQRGRRLARAAVRRGLARAPAPPRRRGPVPRQPRRGAPARPVELLSDVGLGGGLRSVISQGSVETVLGAKPAERRSLVEEAAGLGRFKLRRHRAELKLARVAIQVERARDLEDEVRKRLRPLALQATAAERAAKLGEEVAALEAAIATLDLARLDERRAAAERRARRPSSRRGGSSTRSSRRCSPRARGPRRS